MSDTSIHAYLKPYGEPGAMVFDLSVANALDDLIDEVRSWADPQVADSPDDPPLAVVEFRVHAKGYAATLPEHPGW